MFTSKIYYLYGLILCVDLILYLKIGYKRQKNDLHSKCLYMWMEKLYAATYNSYTIYINNNKRRPVSYTVIHQQNQYEYFQ